MDARVSDHYNLDFINVPANLISEYLKLARKGGELLRLTQANGTKPNGNGTRRRPYTPPKQKGDTREARDVVFSVLQGQKDEVPRKLITKALTAKGYSARSVGPICTLLQRDGVIFSPRRGYWQMK